MTPTNRYHTKNACRPARCHRAFLRASLAVLLVTLLPVLATAAAPAKSAPLSLEDARWFQVELILFAQKTGDPLEAEQWPELEGLLLPDPLLELHLPPAAPAKTAEDVEPADLAGSISPETATTDTPDLPAAFQILAEDGLQLTGMLAKLRRSSRFAPLLHIAWQQPTYDRQHSQPIFFMEGMSDPLPIEPDAAISPDETALIDEALTAQAEANLLSPVLAHATEEDTRIGPPNPRFVGTVTLSVERYLHLAADLQYRQPVTQHSAIPISDLDLWYDRPYPTLSEPQGPAYRLESWQAIRGFQLKESRRMRSREIHYLDHPFMGLIVVITPVELPEPAEEIQPTRPQNILTSPKKR